MSEPAEEPKKSSSKWIMIAATAGVLGSGGVSAVSASTILFLQDFFMSREAGIALERRVSNNEQVLKDLPGKIEKKLEKFETRIGRTLELIDSKLSDRWTIRDHSEYNQRIERRLERFDNRFRDIEQRLGGR